MMRMAFGRRHCAICGLAMAVLLSACSREVDPFEAGDRDANVGGSPNQLTFSPANDRSPTWSADGDSVFFSTGGGAHLPPDSGVLVGLPREGGVTTSILENAQLTGDEIQSWLVTPSLSPTGERLAFIEIVSTWSPHPCDLSLNTLSCSPNISEPEARRPELREISVHARRFDASGPLAEDQQFETAIQGVDEEIVEGGLGSVRENTIRDYPFHQLFRSERAFIVRPSWSPDGTRVVFSDGANLRIWTVGGTGTLTIPGTEDGVWPAWSPDGEWIAFTRLTVADSSNVSCTYINSFGTITCTQERTDFVPGPHILTLVRPDGSESMEIGEGDEPAWSPDGSQLFFRRDFQIWRSAPDGSSATPIPNTENGREPAVSPDGDSLAFARLSGRGDYNIWIIGLGM